MKKRGICTVLGVAVLLAALAASAPADTGIGATTAAAKKCKKKKKKAVAAKKKKCRKAKRPQATPAPAPAPPAVPVSRVRAELTWNNGADLWMQVLDVNGEFALSGSNNIPDTRFTVGPSTRTFIDDAFLAPSRPFSVTICAGVDPPAGTKANFEYTDRNGATTTTFISIADGVDGYTFTEPGSFNVGGVICT